jgi:hypothetical protein
MSETRPLQVVKITLPKCANTHGTSPCTATQTGDAKCFNTFSTCNDPPNFRGKPDEHLTPDLTLRNGDTIASGDITRTADLFAAFDVSFPVTPSGTIWEQGGSADDAAYLGITSTNLVFRAGGGDAADPTDCAKITTAYSAVAGKTVTLYVEIDDSASKVTLWAYDPVELTLTQLGTDTASGSFAASWAGTDGGAIGADGGSNIATGEDGGTFNGVIKSARFYDSTAAPTSMSDDYKLDMYFIGAQRERPADDIQLLPYLRGVRSGGSRINISGQDGNYEPLGGRATLSLTMADAPTSDRVDDPYLSDRTHNPLDFGTFWTKFRIRQRYSKQDALVTIYEGFDGERLANMTARQYILDRIDFSGREQVQIECRDILTRSELVKAQAPVASPGTLTAALTDSALSFNIDNAAVTDYDASGTVRINDEVMTYSAVTDNGDGTLAFTVTTRGTDNTTAAAHNEDDAVQLCLRYSAQAPDDIVADLLINYANIEYQFLDLSGWDGEVSTYLAAYSLTTLITEPVEVKHLIGELSEQAAFYLWWDERAQLVKMNAIRGQTTQPATLDDDEHFVADSFVIRERPDQRISQIWFYYNQRNPVLSTGSEQQHEVTNFQNLFVQTEDQQSAQYKQTQIRSVYSRWITTTALAVQTTSRMARRFADVPVEATFELASKDRSTHFYDYRRRRYAHARPCAIYSD